MVALEEERGQTMTDKQIVAKTKYATSEDDYPSFSTVADAKERLRDGILDKYIRNYEDSSDENRWKYTTTRNWWGKKTIDCEYAQRKARTAADAKQDFLKFYDEIQRELKAIDEQPDPVVKTN